MFNAFGNATQVPPKSWRDEPATRGTWNILSTCLITLGLCLWTALHLNIPRRKEGVWLPKIRKTLWLLMGLLAPEMLAYTAWYQHRAAHKLDTVMRRKLGQRVGHTRARRLTTFFARCCDHRKEDAGRETRDVELDDRKTTDVERDASSSHAAGRRHQWTTAHSFYALMGGFVFDTSDEEINFLPNSKQRLTLTPQGLLYLLEHEPDLIPNISEEYICDKSKASNLAKTLVCLQALWFCVQCIVRFTQGLAVSLLELNVFGHAICALLMYLLWWNKPLDIEEPTVLSGSMAREMCALMCMRSFSGDADSEMYLPELPYGVRYGSERRRNIVETSVKPAEDFAEIKWYQLVVYIFVGPLIEIWDEIMLLFGRIPPQEAFIRRTLECRLEWTATGSVGEQPEKFCQYTAYPVDLDYPSDAIGQKERTTSPCLPLTPAIEANDDLHEQNAGTGSVQPIPLGPSVTTNRINIDGLCLRLGTWVQKKNGDGIIKADVFVPRRPQPDYSPASVTLTHADVLRWRLCARALQRYYPQPQWIVVSGASSHQDFPAYRSVYERSPNWPSSQHIELTKENSDQSLAI